MKTQALAQIPETKHAGGPVVRLSDVVKVYKEGDVEVSAIKGITFDIPRQRFSMIVGPSGSGETTLLNLIGCIDKPTQGTIFVGGQDVGALNDNAISDFRAQRVGFIFQNFSLIPELSGRICSGSAGAAREAVDLPARRLGGCLCSNLEITGFINTDLYDGSSLIQASADYYTSRAWTIGAQVNANVGSRHSDFGSLPSHRVWVRSSSWRGTSKVSRAIRE